MCSVKISNCWNIFVVEYMCGKIKIPLRKSKNDPKNFRPHASVLANKNFRTRKRHIICGKMARGTPCISWYKETKFMFFPSRSPCRWTGLHTCTPEVNFWLRSRMEPLTWPIDAAYPTYWNRYLSPRQACHRSRTRRGERCQKVVFRRPMTQTDWGQRFDDGSM